MQIGYRSLNVNYSASGVPIGFNAHMKGPLLAATIRFWFSRGNRLDHDVAAGGLGRSADDDQSRSTLILGFSWYNGWKREISMAKSSTTEPAKTAEAQRLDDAREEGVPWRQWGPYLSERQWGTVRDRLPT
jgi:hypothetical protein